MKKTLVLRVVLIVLLVAFVAVGAFAAYKIYDGEKRKKELEAEKISRERPYETVEYDGNNSGFGIAMRDLVPSIKSRAERWRWLPHG